jgi:hypothetical protein
MHKRDKGIHKHYLEGTKGCTGQTGVEKRGLTYAGNVLGKMKENPHCLTQG